MLPSSPPELRYARSSGRRSASDSASGLLLVLGLVARAEGRPDPPARALSLGHRDPVATRPPPQGGGLAVRGCLLRRMAASRRRTGRASWRRGAQRARPAARAARSRGPQDACPDGSGTDEREAWSTPVSIVQVGGERWLVAPYGERNWVKNARAAGWVELRRGRSRERLTVEEVGRRGTPFPCCASTTGAFA